MFDDNVLYHYIADCEEMYRLCSIVDGMDSIKDYDQIIFENGQGLLLDGEIEGEALYTTPSRTGMIRAQDLVKEAYTNFDIEVYYASRTYLTRHGDGALNGELNYTYNDPTNVYNEFQRTLRNAKLDPKALESRIKKDMNTIVDTGNHYHSKIYFTHADQYYDEALMRYFPDATVSFNGDFK